jgi:hypothetical protein
MYKRRHLIENFFGKLKEFKRIATRADKTNQSFASMIHLTAAVINSRWTDPRAERDFAEKELDPVWSASSCASKSVQLGGDLLEEAPPVAR